MSKPSRKTVALLAGLAALLVFASAGLAGSTGKFKNYNFETNAFTTPDDGWTWDNWNGNSVWVMSNKKVTPIFGQSWFGPMEKERSALADEFNKDTLSMWQRFKLGTKTSRLSFDLDWKNRSGEWCNPGSVDPFDSCGTGDNQQFMVFVQNYGDNALNPYADPPVKTLVQSDNSTPLKQGKTKYSFNISKLGPGDYQLVFLVTAGEEVLNLGVDEVVINNG